MSKRTKINYLNSYILRPASFTTSTEFIPLVMYTQFFASAITTLQTLVIALGAGLGVWGVVNLLEGYGSDNPGANAHVR